MHLIWAALAGTLVYLDTTAVAQFMICQPLIACPLWGALVGRPEVGLFFGVIFQLLWLGNLQIGAAKFAEGNIGAFVATVLGCQALASPGDPAWLAILPALLMGLFVAQVGSQLAPVVRKIMGRIVPNYVLAAESGSIGSVRFWFTVALLTHIAAGFLFVLLSLWAGDWFFRLFFGKFYMFGLSNAATVSSETFIIGLWPALLGAGSAVALLLLVHRRTIGYYLLAAIIAAGVSWS